MKLRLAYRTQDPAGGAPIDHDLQFLVTDEHTVAELMTSTTDGLYNVEGWCVVVNDHRVLEPRQRVEDAGLVDGDVIELRTPDQPAPIEATDRLARVGGRNAGLSRPLPAPSIVNAVGWHGTDTKVSAFSIRTNAEGNHQLRVAGPRGSLVLVNGREVVTTVDVAVDEPIHVDGEAWAIRAANEDGDPTGAGHQIDQFHRIPVDRSLRYPPTVTGEVLAPIGDVPAKPEPRTVPYLAIAAPLLLAGVMVAISGQAGYLAFMLLSPVIALASFVQQWLESRKRYRRDVERFSTRLDERRQAIADHLTTEWHERHAATPDVEAIGSRAVARSAETWERRRPDERRSQTDFLRQRLGLGTTAPTLVVESETGGDAEYRDLAAEAAEAAQAIDNVPIDVDLMAEPVLAITSPDPGGVQGALRSLLIQAAGLHSPEDLVMAGIIRPSDRALHQWVTWLPHVNANSSPLAGPHLVADANDVTAFLEGLTTVIRERTEPNRSSLASPWPRILLFVDDRALSNRGALTRLIEAGPSVGLSILWLHGTHHLADGELRIAGRTDEISLYRRVDRVGGPVELWPEHVALTFANDVARALAPMVDTSAATGTTSIPRLVELFDTLGLDGKSDRQITPRWDANRNANRLFMQLGMSHAGPVGADLVGSGPHSVVGGTTGSGKSVLLTSMVASLIAEHSPADLNFLFIDYKGGATIQRFEHCPHTVGYLTNIADDPTLAERAITTFRAEREHREKALRDAGVPGVAELLANEPNQAFPLLVVVIDEFAELLDEQPAFASVIINMARVGRSLGIHLILGTQSPGEAIPESVLNNTDIRLALRTKSETESTAVIGRPDAAHLPGPLMGRAYMKASSDDLVPFQTAWADAPAPTPGGRPTVAVHPHRQPSFPDDGTITAQADSTGPTQLDVLLRWVADAADDLAASYGSSPIPWHRKLWLDPPPQQLDLDSLIASSGDDHNQPHDDPTRRLTIGMIDDPKHRCQPPAVIDLRTGGGLLVIGAPRSGLTTALETVAAAAVLAEHGQCEGPKRLELFGIGSGRLTGLERLFGYGREVAAHTDTEAVSRLLRKLVRTINERQHAVREHNRSADADGRIDPVREANRILLLVDGLDQLLEDLGSNHRADPTQELYEAVHTVASQGPAVKVHLVGTATRLDALGTRIPTWIANRIVLRQIDPSMYVHLGVPFEHAQALTRNPEFQLPPGRGFIEGHQVIQLARIIDTGDEDDGDTPLAWLGRRLGLQPDPSVRAGKLPSVAPLVTSPPPFGSIWLGIADETNEPWPIDVSDTNLAVYGPRQSGRSNTLRLCLEQLASTASSWAFVPRRASAWSGVTERGITVVTNVEQGLDHLLDASADPNSQHVVAFDDFTTVIDEDLNGPIGELIERPNVRILGACREFQPSPSSYHHPLHHAFADPSVPKLHLKVADARHIWREHDISSSLPRAGLQLNVRNRGVLVVEDHATIVQVSEVDLPPSATAHQTGKTPGQTPRPAPIEAPVAEAEPADPTPEPALAVQVPSVIEQATLSDDQAHLSLNPDGDTASSAVGVKGRRPRLRALTVSVGALVITATAMGVSLLEMGWWPL